jgi:cytochrome c553
MQAFDTARRVAAIRRAFVLLGLACIAGAAAAQNKGDPARGETLTKSCVSCHGTAERVPLPATPSLAGQQAEFLVLQMFLFREGLREAPQMAGVLKDATDPDFFDIAAHYARQRPPRPGAAAKPALHARGAQLARDMGCGSCHLNDYSGQKQVPRITSQREDYLVLSMKAYRDNKRTGTDTSMNGILYQVPDADIEALAHFLAHQPQ